MSLRTGFLARCFHPFSTLVVSFGYGSPGEGEIPTPVAEVEPLKIGRPGLSVRGETKDGPEFTLKVTKEKQG